MREAVIVDSVRTPLAKSFRGSFNMTRPDDLMAHAIREVVNRVPQVDKAEVEEVYVGCGYPEQEQGMNIGRMATMLAGLPVTTAGATINRFCSSGLQAIACAAHQVICEGVDVAIGGGIESITMTASKGSVSPNDKLVQELPGLYMVMGDTAEVVAKRYEVSRERQDEYSLLSQQRTAEAQERGFFKGEIVPIKVTRGIIDKETKKIGSTEEVTVDSDECNRPDTTLDGLASLKPYFDPNSGQGSVTAGNASQLSDGASATLVMSRERADALGIKPKLIFRGFVVAGCEPDEMGIGPIYAVPKLLKRNGLGIQDIDLWELNEAFAVQVLYCADKLGIDYNKLNINGGSISIGHPFGMTGSRMVGTLANQMVERNAKFGVVTMCVGGGQGAAGLFELAQ
jgi:acetyl-CoA acyltransferase